ncbi:MAG: hypothetical protein JWO77_2699, partial [Ilumatobacteraceae bacterium]|nr:hypothetical protein [Ilumatobacteraceae bacterium]
WAIVFVLSASPPPSAEAQFLERLPLRAAFVDTPTDHLLIVRSTGDQLEALGDALNAVRAVHTEAEGALAFRQIDMIPHEEACDEVERGEPVSFVSMTEAAEKLGVTRQRAAQLLRDKKLPKPDALLGRRPLWNEHAFDTFAQCRRSALEETEVGHAPNIAQWWSESRNGALAVANELGWFGKSSDSEDASPNR